VAHLPKKCLKSMLPALANWGISQGDKNKAQEMTICSKA
jgi:hypothetical protein